MQGKGVGSQLLKWVEDYALERGIHTLCVASNLRRPGAHAFYERNGYDKTSYSFKRILAPRNEAMAPQQVNNI
jgi:GNAT superfamily N-acetyltransferase